MLESGNFSARSSVEGMCAGSSVRSTHREVVTPEGNVLSRFEKEVRA
jgi:hypothetical protein